MGTSRTFRAVLGGVVLAGLAVAVGYAQSQTAVPQDPVAAEIRALRADLNTYFDSTMRGQLLVARLQVQEGRITSVLRQLQEVETKLRENETAKAQMEQALKMFGGGKPGEAEEGAELFLGPIKAGLETAAKTDADLRSQQAQLRTTLNEEQARWVAINARLEELEQVYSKPVKR